MGILLVVGLVVMAAPETPSAAPMMDLAKSQAAKRGGRQHAPPEELVLAALGQAKALVAMQGVPLDGAAEEWLRERLRNRLEFEAERLPMEPGVARREAWERLARAAMTGQLAQEVLDTWLGFAPRTPQKAPAATGAWSQVNQLEGNETFAFQHAAVAEEIGSPETMNGIIDPGEWVKLELTFTNATRRAWFSTTGFAQVQGCAWVDPSRGSVLGEAGPGELASLALWVYVPEGCSSTSSLKLNLGDTHRGAPAKAIQLELRPTTWSRPRVAALHFDADRLGSSDGSLATRLEPDQRIELSANLQVPGEHVTRVEQHWVVSPAVAQLFKALTYRADHSATPLGSGLFEAADDLDGTTIDPESWQALAARQELEDWLILPAIGRAWFALDTVVTLSLPVAAPPMPPPATKVGTPGRLSAPIPSPPPPVTPMAPPASAIARLVQQHVRLVPHSVPKERADALSAASGYELVFDQAAFAAAYEGLFPKPAPTQVPEPPTARYVARLYVAVPASAVKRPEARLPPAPPPVLGAAPPAAPRRRPKPVEQAPFVQVDLGGGAAIHALTPSQAQPNLWTGLDVGAFPALSARTFIGPGIVGTLGFNLNGLSYTFDRNAASYLEVSGDLGAGWRFRWDRVWVTPYVAAMLRYREHSHVSLTDLGIAGVGGVNVRVRLLGAFGLSADLGVPFGINGPPATGPDGSAVGVVSAWGLRANVAASFGW